MLWGILFGLALLFFCLQVLSEDEEKQDRYYFLCILFAALSIIAGL